MNELVAVAIQVQSFCERQGFSFCIIGGLALQHWGEARFTRDVDLTVMTGFGGEEAIVDAFLSEFEGRIENAREFGLQHRVLLLKSEGGIGIDAALGALPFEAEAAKRSVKCELGEGVGIRLCTAEDLITMKAFASRSQDWIDIEGILVRQGPENLDWDYIWTHLRPLAEAKEEPEIIQKLDRLRNDSP